MKSSNAHPIASGHAEDPAGETRNRLLCCAVQIFDRKGYASASVREIAELAGVAKPALYYYFGSKEGVLVAILEEAAREFAETVADAAARTGSALERVQALCRDMLGLFERNVPVVRVAHTMFYGPRDEVPAYDVTRFEQDLRQAIQRIVEDGQQRGEIRRGNPLDLTFIIMGILEACTARQIHPDLTPIGEDGLRRMLELLFNGVGIGRLAQGELTQ
jgi:TetR/AcrR family transcriptional regulator